ncbi:MAG: diphthine--ammonia ligase, partial [Candidatus Thermoplasmatota archaeon]
MRVGVLTSGGKDSLYAAYIMHSQGYELKYLITVLPANPYSYMFHYYNVRLTEFQARSMGIPLLQKTTKGEKEEELEDLKEAISTVKNEIDAIVTGAIASEYQKQRIDIICEELKLSSFAPLWHKDYDMLLEDMLSTGFEIIITAVAAQGLDENWLGRKIDKQCIEDLKILSKKYKIQLAGEGGEYDTFVL